MVRPRPLHPDFGSIGGAYVSCYINSDSLDKADPVARRVIHDQQWVVVEDGERRLMTADEQDDEFYRQAMVDGEVFVFDTWPADDSEDARED